MYKKRNFHKGHSTVGEWQGNGMVYVNRAKCGRVMSGLSTLQGKWYQTVISEIFCRSTFFFFPIFSNVFQILFWYIWFL
jgi:hypothetical protein